MDFIMQDIKVHHRVVACLMINDMTRNHYEK